MYNVAVVTGKSVNIATHKAGYSSTLCCPLDMPIMGMRGGRGVSSYRPRDMVLLPFVHVVDDMGSRFPYLRGGVRVCIFSTGSVRDPQKVSR